MKGTIAILYNTSWGIYNFRNRLIESLLGKGFSVITIAPEDSYTSKLIELGCTHYDIDLNSKSKNPVKDLKYCYDLRRVFKDCSPSIVLNFTAKPNIYGTIVAKSLGFKVINNIAGLGLGFTNQSLMTRILIGLYSYSQKKANHVFFQNPVDRELFFEKRIVKEVESSLLPGSGVDLSRFRVHENKIDENSPFKFLLIARMLHSKGIFILLEAAKKLQDEGITNFEVNLLGDFGINSSDAISKEEIENWNKLPYINYLGRTDNVIPYLEDCNCVVLPTYYREGTPRTLLESLAIGRPIITTDMPGCRDTVNHGLNGYIVKPRDVGDLKDKMMSFIQLSSKQKINLGNESRKLAEIRFDEKFVIDGYLNAIDSL